MTITSPHNELLKEIRKLAGRKWRDKLRQFVAEGEDLLAAADAAGWEPLARLVAEGSGLDGEEVKPHLLAQVSQLGSGTRALGVYGQRWAPSRPGRCAWRCGASTTPATSAPRCAARWRSARPAWRSGPGTADPYGHKAVRASMGALFEVPGRPRAHGRASCRAAGSRSSPTAVSRSRRRRRRDAGGRRRARGPARRGRRRVRRRRRRSPCAAESLNAAMAATVALYECNRRMAAP